MAMAMPRFEMIESDVAAQLFEEFTRLEDVAQVARSVPRASSSDVWKGDTVVTDSVLTRGFDDPLAWCEELLASDAPLALPEVSPVLCVASPPSAGSPCSSGSPDTKDTCDRRLSYRQRQRHEITVLRERVATMEAELERLRSARCGSRRHEQLEPSGAMTHEQRLIVAVEEFWRRAATRERLARQRAVQEHERLRHFVNQNIKVVKTLERLLEQQIQTEIAGQAMTQSQYLERLGVLQEGYTRGIYAFLSHGLASSARMTSDMMARAGMASRLGTYQHSQLHSGAAPDDWFIELKESRFLPFSAQRVSDLSWRCMTKPTSVLANGAFQVDELSPDEVKIKFIMEIPFQRELISMKGWVVGRRSLPTSSPPHGYTSAWSDFLIVEGLTPEPLELREDGWSQLRKLPSDDACVLQDYSRVRSVLSSTAHILPRAERDRMWRVIQAMFSEFAASWYEHWERMLLASSA
ncbi:hypothetical protein P43SY_003776 [Pythium insidiosum]|uniref:M96 mating-specific protein family n=1 Tax=Pythium insidiosum TaxID=114742 RepID=A0AAD5LSQ5_PYTIN|nr:hypothetical protein P43SY_003776 [Pythium insidiosum]